MRHNNSIIDKYVIYIHMFSRGIDISWGFAYSTIVCQHLWAQWHKLKEHMWLSDDTEIERCSLVINMFYDMPLNRWLIASWTLRLLTVTRAPRPSKITPRRDSVFPVPMGRWSERTSRVMQGGFNDDLQCWVFVQCFSKNFRFQFSAILAWPTVTFFHSLYRFSDSSFSEMGELRKSFIGRKQQLCFSLHSSKISDTKSDVNSLRHIATPQLTSKSFKHCHFDSLTFPRCLSHSCRQSSSWKREDNKDFSIPLPHSQRGQPCQQPNRCFSTPFRTCWCHEPGAATPAKTNLVAINSLSNVSINRICLYIVYRYMHICVLHILYIPYTLCLG